MRSKSEKEAQESQSLPPVKDGELATVLEVSVLEKKTKPPSRYTEGTLIEDMLNAGKYIENDPVKKAILKVAKGLGTSATRDSILESLKKYGYIVASGGQLRPSEKGEELIGWLDTHCSELTDVIVTANWEADLDVIAKQGGGAQFETQIIERVRHIITTLRQANPIVRNTSTENKNMNDENTTGAPRSSKPTPKMLQFAERIAQKLGEELPPEVSDDFDKCRAYIDERKDAANRPSEKQLNFAKLIAERKGIEVPAAELSDGRALSKWIDANK